ncbi:MAG: type II toxin-antitoxin system prevent-host-death family antitoxin [Pseudomonadota bacterium]
MKIINFTDARANLRAVIDEAIDNAEATVITRRDAPDAVIMSLDQYNGLMETVYLLSSPANAQHLHDSLAQARAGQVSSHELVELPDAEPEIYGEGLG